MVKTLPVILCKTALLEIFLLPAYTLFVIPHFNNIYIFLRSFSFYSQKKTKRKQNQSSSKTQMQIWGIQNNLEHLTSSCSFLCILKMEKINFPAFVVAALLKVKKSRPVRARKVCLEFTIHYKLIFAAIF